MLAKLVQEHRFGNAALAFFFLCTTPVWTVQKTPHWSAHQKTLERILKENILPFWYPQALDHENGGYRLNHQVNGKWRGPAPKALVTQARTMWFFSALVNSGYGDDRHLEAARHGYRFLRDHLWDPAHEGFYWEVNATGQKATKPDKHLYGQSFGLYALSEYALASGDRSALQLADKLFGVLEERAHDSRYGGYREYFKRDWSEPRPSSTGYMNVGPSIKLMNTHLHLMEAMTTYYQVSKRPLARERLIELILIQSNAVIRKQVGACTDRYREDWTPLQGSEFDRVSYGHDVENVWLLMDACQAAGLANGPLMDLYQTLMDYSLKYGFDWKRGGFYNTGPFNAPADRRQKIWWVQSEGLVGALKVFQRSGTSTYLDSFTKTLNWITQHQVDWENGDWFATIEENGHSSGDKAGPWKSPYHNGRAVIECLKLIARESELGPKEH